MDAHLFGKATLQLYRSLFTFTGALLICAGEGGNISDKAFADGLFSFFDVGVNPRTDFNPIADGEIPEDKRLPWDFLALPQLIVENLSNYPKLFKMIEPASYVAADDDLHMQLAASVSVMLNRCMGSPHMRIEFVNFMLHLVPQKKVPQGQEHNNRLYKDVFFHNTALQRHLMHALIVTYTDSEVTYWYTKFSYRYAAAYVMEYIW